MCIADSKEKSRSTALGFGGESTGVLLSAALIAMLFAVSCATDDLERQLHREDVGTRDVSVADIDAGDADSSMTVDSDRLEDMERDQGMASVCRPNQDGVIERDEVPLRVGLNAKFRVATDVDFDTAGTMENGQRVWDLSGSFESDDLVVVELAELQGRWFASDFPEADYATRLSVTEELLGVFEIADDGLLLHGVASPDDGVFATNLEYDPPVATLEFPISEETSWQTDSQVSGTAQGVVSVFDESYVFTPAGRGLLRTPFGEFQVQRIRSDLERTVGFLTTTIRTYIFVAECFGTVATVRSRDDESDVEFDRAAEIRRLAP